MKYLTKHKIVTGNKHEFEIESNQLSKEGFINIGQFAAINTPDGIVYSQVMTKTINMVNETEEKP